MVPMVKMEVKVIKENKDHKDLQDQKMGVWSLQGGDELLVLQLQELHYSIRGKLLEVVTVNMEVELTTFVYLTNLSIFPIHLVYLINSHIFMEQNTNPSLGVHWHHSMIKMFLVLSVMSPTEQHIS